MTSQTDKDKQIEKLKLKLQKVQRIQNTNSARKQQQVNAEYYKQNYPV